MKKILLFLAIILSIFTCFFYYESSSFCKIFKIESPLSIYIDKNQNFIFDEKKPFILKNIHYINYNSNYVNDEILRVLTPDQKFFLEYMANETANKILKNKFVYIHNSDLYINKNRYKTLLLNSNIFYENSTESKKKLLEYISNINLDDYVIYNTKSKKYHKFSCSFGKTSKNYKILTYKQLPKNAEIAKCCIVQKELKPNINNLPLNKVKLSYSNDNIKIFFLDLNTTFKPDNKCSTEACIELKNQINNAKQTIDFAIYGFNNQPEIYKALQSAKKRGIKIRWVSNYDKSENKYYPDIEKLKILLPDFNSNKNENGSRYSIMHNKFFIFDNEKVFTGSANITSTDLSGFNANYSILITSKSAAEIYTQEFNQMYNGYFNISKKEYKTPIIDINKDTKIKILFSPQSLIIDNYIIELINNAKKYIYIPAFFITHKQILIALNEAKQRNVDIKVINDATNAQTKYTIHKKLRVNGIKVKTENYAGKMHMKSIIIDDKYSVIGSMNFTSSGNKRNDENLVIIENKEVAEYLKGTFLHIWNKIPIKYSTYDPRPESIESIGSCFDGIDNDFDNKIDGMDEGCFEKK